MRRFQKKQILELMRTFSEAIEHIKNLIDKNNIEAAMNLLSECQNSVIKAGNFIEQLEGEGTVTVSYLEEYCDLLYQASLAVENSTSFKKKYKLLQRQINKIENSIKFDLKPEKLELVFLPYKADMWDCLESIYLAAKADPQCDVYCVPIPYFDRNPDGTFGQMHYDGNEYPDYVDITDWQDYNIEYHHPDAIFIHNPYDNSNLVTSVHPYFYAEKLCKLTDMLLYVPYFVAIQVQEHLCFTPGTKYAHKTIVQNEEERKLCIKTYKEYENKLNCVNCFGKAENKFLALGSPKFDKILNTKRENCKLPDAWLRLIGNADGTRKTVVLYNTTLTEILEFNEHSFEKIRSVFEVFKHRNDVVMWWRPHPLTLATCESMRPHLAEEYKSLVEIYRQEDIGIYDDTADLHRAIAWSDAYYGFGGSSVTYLFGATLKPVMALHKVDNISIFDNKYNLKNKLAHSIDYLKTLLSGAPLYIDGALAQTTLLGPMFFADNDDKDLCGFLHFITHMEDYDKAHEFYSLVKAAYESLNVNSEKRAADGIYSYIKKELKL